MMLKYIVAFLFACFSVFSAKAQLVPQIEVPEKIEFELPFLNLKIYLIET